MTIRSFFILMMLALGFYGIGQAATPRQNNKAKVAKRVYKDIERTVRDSRKAPSFNFIFTEGAPVYSAHFDPQNHTINLEEGIYDIAAGFGEDSLNVLALVLGHELAHFYKDHGWGMAFGTSNEDLDIAAKIYEQELSPEIRSRFETEADYFGGLFGYLAGYNTLEVADEFYAKLYEKAGLEDDLAGYPSKAERVSIAANTQESLRQLIPVFDAANYLTMLKRYEEAAHCYEYVIRTFPGRELYNNTGVALVAAALELGETDFQYPFGMDLRTRMSGENRKGNATETDEEKRERLLREARDLFERATQVDKNYAPGYLNLALVMDLLEEPDLGLGYAGKAVRLAEKEGNVLLTANAHLAKGILLAHADEEDEAIEEFELAREGNAYLADWNLMVLEGETPPEPEAEGEIAGGSEAIGEAEPSLMEVILMDAAPLEIEQKNEFRPRMKVYASQEADYTAIRVKTYTTPRKTASFISTTDEFSGKSARGIGIGSSQQELAEKYGPPARTMTGSNETFWVYEVNRMIFRIDEENQVAGWILFND